MIRRSPSETYIKYLLLHPNNYTNDQVLEILQFAQLDGLGAWYLERLRAGLHPPEIFRPFDRSHAPSFRYLVQSELVWVFLPDENGRKAFKMLEMARIKEFLETMLISHAPVEAISHAISTHYHFPVTPTMVSRYKAFFWNVDHIDSTEMRAMLQLRVTALETHPQLAGQYKAMERAFWNDPRRAAADLPFSPLSALVAQVRMGLMPSRVELGKVMEQTRHMVALRIFEAASANGRGDAKKSLDYAGVLEKLTVVLEQVVKPDDQMQNELAKITMRTDDVAIPTIHQLSGGRHTVDNGQVEERHDELPGSDE